MFVGNHRDEQTMPIKLDSGRPSILIRKEKYESAGLVRAEIDSQFNLTDQEFRVGDQLVVLGPLPSDDMIGPLTEYLESKDLSYFDDFFELSGNWPDWLQIHVGR
jgi:hypothetical protein